MTDKNPQGCMAIVLHAHLPFVRHPEHSRFLEEDWLFEAISETYLPLIQVFDGLVRDGVDFRITMTITPPLCEMLADPLLQQRYAEHGARMIDLCEKEVERTKDMPEYRETAMMYLRHFRSAQDVFEKQYGRNIVNAFKKFQDLGVLEVITCTATHGFMPLILRKEAKRAQIKVAANNYRKHFGRSPRGIWLAECGYEPGDEKYLAEEGIDYFFLDTHGILYGTPQPKYGQFAPVVCRNGVAAFARDIESSRQVWSSKEGYPGDFRYREFYRDLGYDGKYDYVKPYLHPDGVRRNLGIKYHKITGKVDLSDKAPYNQHDALEAAAEHAGNFVFNRAEQIKHLGGIMDRRPVVVAPYDAELYGHWWFEGPQFLDYTIRKARYDQDVFALTTCSEYLAANTTNQIQQPTMSTWGAGGYNLVWLNGDNQWMYRHMHEAEDRMTELVANHSGSESLTRRALNQAARELLLAQSSDWAFIITTNTMVPYAIKRFNTHISRFNRLYDEIKAGAINENWLGEIEALDNIFGEIDHGVFAPVD